MCNTSRLVMQCSNALQPARRSSLIRLVFQKFEQEPMCQLVNYSGLSVEPLTARPCGTSKYIFVITAHVSSSYTYDMPNKMGWTI